MPKIHIDMSATATDFDIDFPNASNIKGEFVIQDAGSDNGFMRTKDGMCGEWTKSSANVFHTPKSSNGSQVGTTGDISVSRAVVRGTELTGSRINYDVVGAPSYAFPITLQIYLDNGSIAGQLDANDTYVESNMEYTLSDGGFSTTFFPYDYDVLVVVNSVVGCIDKILYTPNASTLPVQLISFDGDTQNDKAFLKWTVGENEGAKKFEIEKSIDGKNFTSIATIAGSGNTGTVNYSFTENQSLQTNTYYRLKVINKTNSNIYSKVVFIKSNTNSNKLQLMENPVTSGLKFSYNATTNSIATINIYSTTGVKLYASLLPVQKQTNAILDIDLKIPPGMYILELINSTNKNTTKFIKR